MKTASPIFLTLLFPAILFGQILAGGGEAYPVPAADRHLPMGIRAAGMGAAVASANEYSALFYNPANLAYIYDIQMGGALHADNLGYRSALDGNSAGSGSDLFFKIQNYGLVIPLEDEFSGITLAAGFARTNSFDRTLEFRVEGDDGILYDGSEQVRGGLGKFSVGGGMQMNSALALGLSLDFYCGGEEYDWYLDRQNVAAVDWPDTLERVIHHDNIADDYYGIGARFGMLVTPARFVQLGLYFTAPTPLYIEEQGMMRSDSLTSGTEYYDEVYDYVGEIELTLPPKAGAGIALRPTDWLLLAGDAEFADWREIKYREPAWILDQNRLMDDSYRATLRWSAGTEVFVPGLSLRIRGGFSQEPIPYLESGDDRMRNGISGGLGYSIGDNTSMDLAALYSTWNAEEDRLEEDYTLSRVWLGLTCNF